MGWYPCTEHCCVKTKPSCIFYEDDFDQAGSDIDPTRWTVQSGTWDRVQTGSWTSKALRATSSPARIQQVTAPPAIQDNLTRRIVVDVWIGELDDQAIILVTDVHQQGGVPRYTHGVMITQEEFDDEDNPGETYEAGVLRIVESPTTGSYSNVKSVELPEEIKDKWWQVVICISEDPTFGRRYLLASMTDGTNTYTVSTGYDLISELPDILSHNIELDAVSGGSGGSQIAFDNYVYYWHDNEGYEHCPGCPDSNQCYYCGEDHPNTGAWTLAPDNAPRYMQLEIVDGGLTYDPNSECSEQECRDAIFKTYILRHGEGGCSWNLEGNPIVFGSCNVTAWPYISMGPSDLGDGFRWLNAGIIFDSGVFGTQVLYQRDDVPAPVNCFGFNNYQMLNNAGEGFAFDICYFTGGLANWIFRITSLT